MDGAPQELSHYPDPQQKPNWPFTAPCFTHSAHFNYSAESFSNVLWKADKRALLLFFPSKQDKTLCHCRSPLGVSMDAAFVSLLLPLLLGLLLFLFSFRHFFFSPVTFSLASTQNKAVVPQHVQTPHYHLCI